MPRSPEPLPDPLNAAPFSYAEATSAGVGRRRLRHADVAHPHRDVYTAEVSDGSRGSCAGALPLLGPHRWFSHLTAARLWGIPLPFEWAAGEALHVMTLTGAEPLRRPGIVGWESADELGVVQIDGMPVVGAASVWAQLSVPGATGIDPANDRRRALSRRWLVAAGDFLLTGPREQGRRMPVCTTEAFAEAVRRHRGKRGAKSLAWAFERVRSGPQSPRESLLRLALVDRGLPEPQVQIPVRTTAGIRHADLGYPEARVLIEYQGDHHRTERRQWLEDQTRRQLFEEEGYRVFEVGMDAFDDDCLALAQRLRRALDLAAAAGISVY